MVETSFSFVIQDSENPPHKWTVQAENANAAKLRVVWKHFYEYPGCKPFDAADFENFLNQDGSNEPESYTGVMMYRDAHEILYNKLSYIPQYQK